MNPPSAPAGRVPTRRLPLSRLLSIALGAGRGGLRGKARLRRWPILHRGVRVYAHHGDIAIGHLTELHGGVRIAATGKGPDDRAVVRIGDGCSIWYNTVISARESIVIGDRCAISWNCTILDSDMHQMLLDDAVPEDARAPSRPVVLEDRVWLGTGVTVLKGVRIGHDSVVAAGSLVTRDVPPHTLVAGSPAKPIREIRGWR